MDGLNRSTWWSSTFFYSIYAEQEWRDARRINIGSRAKQEEEQGFRFKVGGSSGEASSGEESSGGRSSGLSVES